MQPPVDIWLARGTAEYTAPTTCARKLVPSNHLLPLPPSELLFRLLAKGCREKADQRYHYTIMTDIQLNAFDSTLQMA